MDLQYNFYDKNFSKIEIEDPAMYLPDIIPAFWVKTKIMIGSYKAYIIRNHWKNVTVVVLSEDEITEKKLYDSMYTRTKSARFT